MIILPSWFFWLLLVFACIGWMAVFASLFCIFTVIHFSRQFEQEPERPKQMNYAKLKKIDSAYR